MNQHILKRWGNEEFVKWAISKGIDVNRENDDGYSALMAATPRGESSTIDSNTAMMEWSLKADANWIHLFSLFKYHDYINPKRGWC